MIKNVEQNIKICGSKNIKSIQKTVKGNQNLEVSDIGDVNIRQIIKKGKEEQEIKFIIHDKDIKVSIKRGN